MTYAEAAANLRNNGAFYADPIMCAVADGNYNAMNGMDISEYDWRGVVVGDKYFKNEAVMIGYRNGFKQGAKRRAKIAKRGW